MATRCCWPPDSSPGRCLGVVGQADERRASARTRSSRSRAADAGDAQRHADVLRRRQHRDQPERLEDVAHGRPGAAASGSRRPSRSRPRPATRTVPAVGRVQAADDVEQRGLARPGPAAQRDQLALGAIAKLTAAQGVHGGRAAAEGAGHVDATTMAGRSVTAAGVILARSPSRPHRRRPPASARPPSAGPARRRCGRAPARAARGRACPSASVMLARQLQPPDPVEHGVLHGVPALPTPSPGVVPQGLRAGPAVADRDGPPDLRGHRRVVGDDQDGDAQLGVGGLQRGEHLARRSRCPARRSARRRAAARGSLASAVAIATRCCSPPDIWSGRRSRQSATPSASSSSPARARRAAGGRARPASSAASTFCVRGQVGQQVAGGLLPDEADWPRR